LDVLGEFVQFETEVVLLEVAEVISLLVIGIIVVVGEAHDLELVELFVGEIVVDSAVF